MRNKLGQFVKGNIPWMKDKHPIPWNKGIPRLKETKDKISRANRGRKLTEEWKRKISDAHKKEKAYNWIKDRSKLKKDNERNDVAYQEWRKQVWKRDNWKCKIDDNNCKGRLIAHHILSWRDYPELRYDVNNGITLCQAHHPRKRAEEKRLIPIFQGLVSVSSELI